MTDGIIKTVPCSIAAKGVNVTKQVVEALDTLCETGGTLTFEKGEYHFYEDGAYKSFFAPSNNSSGQKWVCFPVLDAENITIDGNGAIFVFHGRCFPFIVSQCKHVTLKNIVIDTSFSPYAQALITEKTEEGFSVHIDRKKSPFRTKDGHLIFECESYSVSTGDEKLSLHAKDRVNIQYLFAGDTASSKENLAAPFLSTDAFDLGDRVYFRYREGEGMECPYEMGETIVINLEQTRERIAFFLENSEDVTVENVVIRRFGGMGIMAQLCRDVTIKRIVTDQAHHDGVSLTADAIHMVNTSGNVEIADCDMESFLDDAINIHGVYSVVDGSENGMLHAHFGHADHDFLDAYKEGDRVVFIHPKTLEECGNAIVSDMYFTDSHGKYFTLSLSDATSDITSLCGYYIENPDRMPDIYIHNNRFYNYPHVRLSGAGKIRVENNIFAHTMAGLVLYDLAEFWYESGRIKDAVIENNDFLDSNALGGDAVIKIGLTGFSKETAPVVHENITLTNNRFRGTYASIVDAFAVKNFVHKNQVIK